MELCSSEESLLGAQQSPPEKQSEVDEGENALEPPLSPGLLAELSLSSFTPMRITRRMASMRESFTKSLGISVREPEKTPGDEDSAPAARKTGKRSAGRGAGRSGWTKSSAIVKDSEKNTRGKQKKGVNEVKKRGKKKGVKKSGKKKVGFGDETDDDGGEDVSSGVTEGEPAVKLQLPKIMAKSPGVGWVMCDDCRKWRCISSELADAIESSDVKWTCKENPNRKFADCSVPQEKTNAEINAELNISEISTSEGDDIDAAVSSKSRASWSQIQHNIFHHRQQKTLDDDDTLICQCRAPADGLGCGEDCWNRMMNVECSPDTCPCGDSCSNQQFGKRMYAKFELIRCGKKGFGLRAVEHIPKGSFIIEYVGEVLDMRAFELRQKEYTREGQKHFYFMTLNSSEVIDACRKGNLGRFINHSCEPNCATEKWCVNGEICIGLFAIRDLKRNEEITFNYNFERLYGAAARRCHCGSSSCTGFIGEAPKPGDVVQSDSDEDLEPVMMKEEDESDDENVLDTETPPQAMEICTPPEETKLEPEPELELEPEFKPDLKPKLEPEPELKPKLEPVRVPKPEPELEPPVELKPKSLAVPDAKTCRVKRAKAGGRPKKIFSRGFKPIACRSSRTEVEDKLDRLLNTDGGLSKKKDTPKQYLKLLVISTASGDASSEGTSCNMRDLSLLLDAMLKTTSRTILNEVIQKNGFLLLHNLVKQSRKSFTKIPILRKLLKVLELLADRKILSSKEMTSTPPRNGMESFVKSIFELTRHEDMQVQIISRRFQKNWIPDMFDILANDRSAGNQFVHKHWGPDRFSQKRELFRSDQRPRPAFNDQERPHNNDQKRQHSSEQDEKPKQLSSDHGERPLFKPQQQQQSSPQLKQQQYSSGEFKHHPGDHHHEQKPVFRNSGDHHDERPQFRHSGEHHQDFRHSSEQHHDERPQLKRSSGDHHDERLYRKPEPEPEPEQEAKRRKKASRWDEMPVSNAYSMAASSSVQQAHQESFSTNTRRDESTTPTTAVVEPIEPEPPGYSSKLVAGNCRRQLEHHRAPPESPSHHYYHHHQVQQQQARVDHPASSSDWRRVEQQKFDRPGSSEAPGYYRRALEPPVTSSEAYYRRPAEYLHRTDRPGSSEVSYRREALEPPGTLSEACYRRTVEHHRPGSSEGYYRRGTLETPPGTERSSEGYYRRGALETLPGTTSEAHYRRSDRPESSEAAAGHWRGALEPSPGTSLEASYRSRPGSSEAPPGYRRELHQQSRRPGSSEAAHNHHHRRALEHQDPSPPGAHTHRSVEKYHHHHHHHHDDVDHEMDISPPPGVARRSSSESYYHHQEQQQHYSSGTSSGSSYRRPVENHHHHYQQQQQQAVEYSTPASTRANQWHRGGYSRPSYRPHNPSSYTGKQAAGSYYQQQQQQQSYEQRYYEQSYQQESYQEAPAPASAVSSHYNSGHYNSIDQGYNQGYQQDLQGSSGSYYTHQQQSYEAPGYEQGPPGCFTGPPGVVPQQRQQPQQQQQQEMRGYSSSASSLPPPPPPPSLPLPLPLPAPYEEPPVPGL